jgi:hypothetical protein
MNENEHIDNLHCKHCGAELASDSIFCEQCGKRVKPNKWLFIILAFAMLLVGGGLWYYMTHRSGKEPLPKPKPTYTISVKSSDETMGTVIGGGSYDTIITVTIEALANEGYQFVSWNDGYKERQRKVVTDHNQEYEAQFENKPETPEPPTPTIPKFLIRVEPSDPSMGTVTGGGTYDSLSVIRIEAIAEDGFKFSKWNDGNKKNPRTVTVLSNQKFTASFIKTPVDWGGPVQTDWNGVATYTGPGEGGRPEGVGGKLVFYSNYQLELKDINGTKLDIKAGETIEDTKFVNYRLRQGTLHRKDGSTKWFNI